MKGTGIDDRGYLRYLSIFNIYITSIKYAISNTEEKYRDCISSVKDYILDLIRMRFEELTVDKQFRLGTEK